MTNYINKTNKILLAIIVVLAAALIAIIYWQKVGFSRNYWAIYLDTGDLYFGKLNYFPRFSLTDAYLLQRNEQSPQNPFSVSKFSNAFWGPEDKIYINKEKIVWKTKLKSDSQVVNFIKNPQSAPSAQTSQPTSQPPVQIIPIQPTSTINENE
jgi:hypothetical protein